MLRIFTFLFLIIYSSSALAQTQIGQTIYEEQKLTLYHKIHLSGDGKRLAVGIPKYTRDEEIEETGIAKVYELENGIWRQIGQTIHGDSTKDYCGSHVQLSKNGNTLLVGFMGVDLPEKYGCGLIRIFTYKDSIWSQIGQDIYGERGLIAIGKIASLSSDGQSLIVATGSGVGADYVQRYIFRDSTWVKTGQKIEFPYEMRGIGGIVASSDHDKMVFSFPAYKGPGPFQSFQEEFVSSNGILFTYVWQDSLWEQLHKPIRGKGYKDEIGESLAMSQNGKYLVYSQSRFHSSGFKLTDLFQAYRYRGDSLEAIATQIAEDLPPYIILNEPVMISNDAKTIVIGYPAYEDSSLRGKHMTNQGKVNVYRQKSGRWSLQYEIPGSHTMAESGYTISLSDDGKILATGECKAISPDYNGPRVGMIRVFRLD